MVAHLLNDEMTDGKGCGIRFGIAEGYSLGQQSLGRMLSDANAIC